jgi:hypothetical protein
LDQLVQLALPDRKALREIKDLRVSKAVKACPVQMAQWVLKDLLDHRATPDLKVPKVPSV